MARAEAPLSKLPWMPTTQQTDKEDLHLKAHSKTVIVSVFTWRPSQTVRGHTLLQIWRSPTTLSIKYTVSSSDRLAVIWINSTCTFYNIVNKRILITANKRIHIISAYFLAAASDKGMHLLTSLYGN